MEEGKGKGWSPWLFFLFGLYVLAGALAAVVNAEWPIFMPPQLDIFGFLLSLFGKPAGAYLGAAFLAAVGGFLTWVGGCALRRPHT